MGTCQSKNTIDIENNKNDSFSKVKDIDKKYKNIIYQKV